MFGEFSLRTPLRLFCRNFLAKDFGPGDTLEQTAGDLHDALMACRGRAK